MAASSSPSRAVPSSPSRAVTAQQAALDHLRAQICSGALAPDARIGQEQVATDLGSSVIPVREALKVLEAEGQVIYAPRRGYTVARLGIKELVEAYRLRELLEDEAVRLAVPRLDERHVSVLEEALVEIDRCAGLGDLVGMAEANRRFHFTLFEAADMPRLTNFVRMLWQSTDPYRARYYAEHANRERVDHEHRAVLAAVRARDVEATLQHLRDHRRHAVERLRLMLGDDES